MSISAAESRIMEALWRSSPRTAEEIVADVAGPQGWSEPTVKSLINRLLTKGAIAAEKAGRRYLYRPIVDREAYVSQESRGLLDRLFSGRIAPLVSHFSETNQLSPEDVAELKRLIAELDDDR
jgi:BlaI family transcriptional regulator, penicillinase repressor